MIQNKIGIKRMMIKIDKKINNNFLIEGWNWKEKNFKKRKKNKKGWGQNW
jgi:hypothetical protein